MSIRLEKPFQILNEENIEPIQAQLGVYQLAEPNGYVIYIGYAGGRSLFGLNSELKKELELRAGKETLFRYEVNMQYITRYEELLMLHKSDFGELPERVVQEHPHKVGTLNPLS